jgi:transcriptional regulator
MYDLPFFKAHQESEVFEFMQAHPFVCICGISEDGFPVAAQIPVLITKQQDKIVINGHLMVQQAHTKAFEQNNKVLVIFSAPSSFVSASWYTDPYGASTWNYQSVHASGLIQFKDQAHLLNSLELMTQHFEKDANAPSQVHNLSKEYMEKHMKAIVSFDIVITDLKHVFKLSQNRDKASYQRIKDELQKGDASSQYIANAMKRDTE